MTGGHSNSLFRWCGFIFAFAMGGLGILLVLLLLLSHLSGTAGVGQFLWRQQIVESGLTTLFLVIAVTALSWVVGIPLAWLTGWREQHRRLINFGVLLALAMPGYVAAFGWQSFAGDYGFATRSFGVVLPGFSGFFPAAVLLSLSNFPFVFFAVRAALVNLDPVTLDAARLLGFTPGRAWFRVVLPQLRPALLTSFGLILVHVVGDFGVVGMMGVETLSFRLYTLFSYGNLSWALGLIWILLLIPVVFVLLESFAVSSIRPSLRRRSRPHERAGCERWLLFFPVVLVGFALLPALTGIVGWVFLDPVGAVIGATQILPAAVASLTLAIPVVALAVLTAVVMAWLAWSHEGVFGNISRNLSLLTYSFPPVALALGFLTAGRYLSLSLSFVALFLALSIHFVAEAVNPIRSGLSALSPQIVEAARTLGCSEAGSVLQVVLPLLRRPVGFAMVLVFLEVLKELPLTLILAPPGMSTLATELWALSSEALFAQGAPFAMVLLLISGVLAATLSIAQRRVRS